METLIYDDWGKPVNKELSIMELVKIKIARIPVTSVARINSLAKTRLDLTGHGQEKMTRLQ